jgi:hypothetical protein
MRRLLLLIASLIAGAGLGVGQSHPGWWTFAAPDSKTLVGIHWQTFQDSARGEYLRHLFSVPEPPYNQMTELPCLLRARDLLISSPELVIGASGGCTTAELKSQATERGWKHSAYKGFEIWVGPTSSVLQWTERVVLIGAARDLRAVVDRSLEEKRGYSPLLITGAKLARENDLWVVSTDSRGETALLYATYAITPDEDGVVVGETIGTSVVLQAESAKRVTEIVEGLRKVNPGAEVSASGMTVTATARVAKGHPTVPAAPMDRVVAGEPVIPPAAVAAVNAGPSTAASNAPPKVDPVKPEIAKVDVTKAEPAQSEPQVIRIFGLDDGPREIVLPPKQPR